jgi:hypothetical protein
MKLGAISLAFALVLTATAQAQQTRFYGPDGKSTGTASTNSSGVTTFRDSRGNTTGTATRDSQGTTFRDNRGNVTGRTTPGARR